MDYISDDQFNNLITKAMNELPQDYISSMKNVAIVMADEPTDQQKEELRLRHNNLLLGLFEGVPRTMQTGNEAGLIPGKITLFKNQLQMVARDEASLFEQIKRTLWHEIAHYYGLNHDDINRLEQA
ncbi:metallopeptidase family protein [Candidatus Nomurabacteria bacterium]|nr:metallopeptidase family protein [Candidatus Nomurabacteria bacterium]